MKTILFELNDDCKLEQVIDQSVQYPIVIGQIAHFHGYGNDHERLAVYKIEKDPRWGSTYYHLLNLDKPKLSKHEHLRPLETRKGTPIGIYYKQGDIATQEEIDEIMPMAQAYEQREADRRKEAERIGKENVELSKKWWAENTPSWAKSFIIAEFEINESDAMTDYFGSRTDKTLLLAFSATERNNFDELRNACKEIEGLEHLVEKNDQLEHRENYSGGAGYYLGKHRYSGWRVSKVPLKWKIGQGTFVVNPENIRLKKETKQIAQEGAQPTGDKIALCKLNTSKGGIEIYFNSKPSTAVLDDLKANGFRWGKFNKCWYKIDTTSARNVASKYATIPEDEEVNQDAGIVDAQEEAAIANGNY